MRNITLTEWSAVLVEMEALVKSAYPWLVVDRTNQELSVKSGYNTMVVGLEGVPGNIRAMSPEVRSGSWSSLSGAPEDLLAGLDIQRDTVLALLKTRAHMSRVLNWPQYVWLADCPCDYCSGTGGRHNDCKTCNGTGTRAEVVE